MPRLGYSSSFPPLLARKLYKTGQTRGAERDEIYQNRVSRNSTAIIPLGLWINWDMRDPDAFFEKEYIVVARPLEYFSEDPPNPKSELPNNLYLGENFLIYYRLRDEWDRFNPMRYGWSPANSRTRPLGGEYIARVPDTTSERSSRIFQGYTDANSGGVGAGIRVYEYASSKMLELTRYQLSYLAWRTEGMLDFIKESGVKEPQIYKRHVDDYCEKNGLADKNRLEGIRLLMGDKTVCPLCLQPITAIELASMVQQVEGRETPDLTVTSANLFHIEELRPGVFNHRIYNLGWGHHHCNTVTRDYGVKNTLNWMSKVLETNGYKVEPPQ